MRYLIRLLIVATVAATPLSADAQSPPATHPTPSLEAMTDADLHELFDRRTREYLDAWASADPDAPAAFYHTSDPDLRVWDAIFVPDGATGWEPYFGEVRPWLETVESLAFELHDDLQVRNLGDAVLTTRTDTMTATEAGGEPYTATSRRSLVWREIGGEWIIVHEHTSTPPTGNE